MLVPKMVWWLMEWVCRRLWELYPPTTDFFKVPERRPRRSSLNPRRSSLNPGCRSHWGRFVTYSICLQGYVARLIDRVII